MVNHKPVIVLVGAGSMGGSMMRSWLSNNSIDKSSAIIDPNINDDLAKQCSDYGLSLNPDLSLLQSQYDNQINGPLMVVFAVKPQMADKVLPNFSHFSKRNIFISVMAGITIATMHGLLNGADKLIRVMPNLPAKVGLGVSGLFATDKVSLLEKEQAAALLDGVGQSVWVETEDQIDMVTAISGSGPAYFFLMVEALAIAGKKLGLSDEVAKILARSTAIGAGGLMSKDQTSAQALREAVTSPGGTTAAALSVLNGDEESLIRLMEKATQCAFDRAQELAG